MKNARCAFLGEDIRYSSIKVSLKVAGDWMSSSLASNSRFRIIESLD